MTRQAKLNLTAILVCLSAMALVSFMVAPPVAAQELPNLDKKTAEEVLPKKTYSPNVDENYPKRVFWGDTHLHTSQSFDAVMFGTRQGPEEAYRFARGEEVVSSTGQRVQWWRITQRAMELCRQSWLATPG